MIPSRMLNTNTSGDLRHCLSSRDLKDGVAFGTHSDPDANAVDVYDDWTLSLWVNPRGPYDSDSAHSVFFSYVNASPNYIGIRFNAGSLSAYLRTIEDDGSADGSTDISNLASGGPYCSEGGVNGRLNLFRWHHIIISFKNNSAKGADDGTLDVMVNGTITKDAFGHDKYASYKAKGGSNAYGLEWGFIGKSEVSTNYAFDGLISNVTYWNTNLSQANMAKLYEKGRGNPYGISDSNLKNWWPLGAESERLASAGNDAEEIRDYVGSAHGTLSVPGSTGTTVSAWANLSATIVPMESLY